MTLVELLMSMGLTVTLGAAAMTLVGGGQTIARTQPETSDLQQRARVALRVLKAELDGAGAGVERGPLAGALARYFPPVATSVDGGLTLWTVSSRDAQGTLRSTATRGATMVALDDDESCPAGQGACAFLAGTTAILFDASGCYEAVRVDAVANDTLTLRSGVSACTYAAGAAVAEGRVFTYRVDRTARQLQRRDEALGTMVPILDGAASMDITYLTDPWRARVTVRLVASNPLLQIPDLVVSLDVAPANLQGP